MKIVLRGNVQKRSIEAVCNAMHANGAASPVEIKAETIEEVLAGSGVFMDEFGNDAAEALLPAIMDANLPETWMVAYSRDHGVGPVVVVGNDFCVDAGLFRQLKDLSVDQAIAKVKEMEGQYDGEGCLHAHGEEWNAVVKEMAGWLERWKAVSDPLPKADGGTASIMGLQAVANRFASFIFNEGIPNHQIVLANGWFKC